jgi:serine protease Do
MLNVFFGATVSAIMVNAKNWLVAAFVLMLASGPGWSQGLPDFTGIVERHSPAVVKITTLTHARQSDANPSGPYGGVPPEQIPEIFRHFFEYRGRPQEREAQSLGSGFIISTDGYVITNFHVVDGADEVTVRLSDRREFDAKVVGSDRQSDIALLKVKASNLPTVKFAQPGELKVGEWVLAIGSPFGLDYSVSAGIVSAIGRSIPNERNENYVPFIQTDVAINPGNSGGPLFNLKGEVVGVNSQIYTRSGGSIGLSFSIPVGLVIDVTEQLKQGGSVARGRLGVGIQDVDKDLAESFGLPKPAGALVSYVEEGGPAEDGGIEVGDIILEFDGREVQTSAELPHIVGLTKPGSRVVVVVLRDGKQKDIKVKVGQLDSDGDQTVAGKAGAQPESRLGMQVAPLEAELKSRWEIDSGVRITHVADGSPAAMAKLKAGDVLTLLAGKPVKSPKDFERIVAGLPSKKMVPARIVRGGQAGFVAIQVP